MAIGLAFKAFFAVLFNRNAADAVRRALAAPNATAEITAAKPAPAPKPAAPAVTAPQSARSDALTLLSTLQREARLLDLVYEPLDSFDDAQIGSAARQVLSEAHKALDRMFAIEPLSSDGEGSEIDVPKPIAPIRCKLVGRGIESAARGCVVHRGWKAGRCQVPSWNGSRDDSLVLAPVEIEVDG